MAVRMSPASLACAVLLVAGCGTGSGTTGDASPSPGDGGTDASQTDAYVMPPPGLQVTTHAVNIVDAAAAQEIRDYVLGSSPELYTSIAAFYAHFDDEYDFVYVFSDAEVPMASAYARFTPVHRPAMPSIGLPNAYDNPMYGGHTHLRGAIGVNFTQVGNGPTIHETLHYWGTFLDRSFGFGVDRDNDFGAHWGVAGVHGQHGGFDPTTVQCGTPMGMPPPCMPDADGITRLTIGEFGPTANGGDAIPYAPIELYLMGLVPRAEVPSPILVVDSAHFVSADMATHRLAFEIAGTHEVTMDQIVALHGERPPADAADRAFRAAFVCFSDAPLAADRMAALERWAAVFGNDATTGGLLSFEGATGGRATMSTRLGAAH